MEQEKKRPSKKKIGADGTSKLSKVRNKKKRNRDLGNTSSNKSWSFNCSLNSTQVKTTLRSNNRALARALEARKQELRDANERIMAYKDVEQRHLVELRRLRDINLDIEAEVTARMEKRMMALHLVLQRLFTSQRDFVDQLTAAMELCAGGAGPGDGGPAEAAVLPGRGPRGKPATTLQGAPLRVPRVPDERGDGQLGDGDVGNVVDDHVAVEMETGLENVDLAELEDTDPADPSEPDPLDTTGPLPDPLGPGAGYPCGLMSAPDLSMIVEKSFLTDIAFTDEPVLAAMEEIPESSSQSRSSRSGRGSHSPPSGLTDPGTATLDTDTLPTTRKSRSRSGSRSRRHSSLLGQASDITVETTETRGVTGRSRSRTRTTELILTGDTLTGESRQSSKSKTTEQLPVTDKDSTVAQEENKEAIETQTEKPSSDQPQTKESEAKPARRTRTRTRDNLVLKPTENVEPEKEPKKRRTRTRTREQHVINAETEAKTAKSDDDAQQIKPAKEKRTKTDSRDSSESVKSKDDDTSKDETPDAEPTCQVVADVDSNQPKPPPKTMDDCLFLPKFIPLDDAGSSKKATLKKKTPPSKLSTDKNKESSGKKKIKLKSGQTASSSGDKDNAEKTQTNEKTDDIAPESVANEPTSSNKRLTYVAKPDTEPAAVNTTKPRSRRRGTFVKNTDQPLISQEELQQDPQVSQEEASQPVAEEKETLARKSKKSRLSKGGRRGTYCVRPVIDVDDAEMLMDQNDSLLLDLSSDGSPAEDMADQAVSSDIHQTPNMDQLPVNPEPPAFKIPALPTVRIAPPRQPEHFPPAEETIIEEEDMELTEVLNPRALAQLTNSVGEFTSPVAPGEQPDHPDDCSPSKANEARPSVDVPDFIRLSVDFREPEFLRNVDNSLTSNAVDDDILAADFPVKTPSEVEAPSEPKPAKRSKVRKQKAPVEPMDDDDDFKTTRRGRKISKINYNVDDDDSQEVPAKKMKSDRSRSKSRKSTEPQSRRDESSDAESVASSQSDSEGDKVKKFSAYITKPGKISFTAGRKNVYDLIKDKIGEGKARSKSRSALPLVKPRSKARSKSRLNKLELPMLSSDSDDKKSSPKKKSAFDMSLSDSICEKKPKQSYSEFVGRDAPQIKPTVFAPSRELEQSIAESPHGIMLVLGNGKRIRPRGTQRKSVHYTGEEVVRSRSPPRDSDTDTSPTRATTPPRDDHSCPRRLENAGSTPNRNIGERTKQSICIPESPMAATGTSDSQTGPVLSVMDSPEHASPRQRPRKAQTSSGETSSDDGSPLVRVNRRSRPLLVSAEGSPQTDNQPSEPEESPKKACEESDKEGTPKKLGQKKNSSIPVKSPAPKKSLVKSKSAKSPKGSPKFKVPVVPKSKRPPSKKSPKSKKSDKKKILGEVTVKQEPISPPRETEDVDTEPMATDIEPMATDSEPMATEMVPDNAQEDTSPEESNETPPESSEKDEEVVKKEMEPTEEEAPRRRRAAKAVSYKEPKLGGKLRRGDDHTSSIYGKGDAPVIFKADKDRKKSSSKKRRSALSTISNTLEEDEKS